jgi:hypothetical protein
LRRLALPFAFPLPLLRLLALLLQKLLLTLLL